MAQRYPLSFCSMEWVSQVSSAASSSLSKRGKIQLLVSFKKCGQSLTLHTTHAYYGQLLPLTNLNLPSGPMQEKSSSS